MKKMRKKSNKKSNKKVILGLGAIILLYAGISAFSGNKDTTETADGNMVAEESVDNEDEESVANESKETDASAKSVETSAKESAVKNEDTESDAKKDVTSAVEGTMEVHYIDVGQGDATLIKCNGHSLLIDAGDNSKGTTVQMYLKKQGVDKNLDAVIWTHPDADHIGGADVIVTKYDIGTIYQTSLTADTKTYKELMDAIAYKGYKTVEPSVGDSFELGGALVTFLGPCSKYDNDNDNSIACLVQFGDSKFLFTGDAEQPAESAIVKANADLSADVYKVGHHGSHTSSSKELISKIKPTYAVISCSEDNSYGHPHSEVLNRLRKNNIQVFRTDEQGSIIATSDGKNITWNTMPSDTWKAGEAKGNGDAEKSNESKSKYGTAPEGAIYIGNKNNMKLHKATCDGLPQSQNQVLFDTLEDAVAAGYTKDNQCKKCIPFEGSTVESTSKGETEKEAPAPIVETPQVTSGSMYVLNTNSHKFHYPQCDSVGKMAAHNRKDYSGTRDEIIAMGYDPCGNCHP